MEALATGSELQLESDNSVYSHQPSSTIMCDDALDVHVIIGGRLITNFADDIVVNAEEEEADVLVDRLDSTSTRYKM